MIPYVVIGLITVVVWGIWGKFAGIVAFFLSWGASRLLGEFALRASGGFLPKKVRRERAEKFLAEYSDSVSSTAEMGTYSAE